MYNMDFVHVIDRWHERRTTTCITSRSGRRGVPRASWSPSERGSHSKSRTWVTCINPWYSPDFNLSYTGWPRKNAYTLTINNFKKTRDRMKKLCALLRIKFFFQQDDTKIVNFDEGVLILEPLFWGIVIFKFCTFCIKSHVWGREEFLWVAPPDSNAAKLRNECFSVFMLASLYKARADTLPGEAKQWKIFGT